MVNLIVRMYQDFFEHYAHFDSECHFVPAPCCQDFYKTIDEGTNHHDPLKMSRTQVEPQVFSDVNTACSGRYHPGLP